VSKVAVSPGFLGALREAFVGIHACLQTACTTRYAHKPTLTCPAGSMRTGPARQGAAAHRCYMELNLLGGRRMARAAGMLRHLPASLGAATAGLSALSHHIVAGREFIAVFGAVVADFGTDGANSTMQLRISQHEITRRLADLGAVEQ
jgi:hypothetical protein